VPGMPLPDESASAFLPLAFRLHDRASPPKGPSLRKGACGTVASSIFPHGKGRVPPARAGRDFLGFRACQRPRAGTSLLRAGSKPTGGAIERAPVPRAQRWSAAQSLAEAPNAGVLMSALPGSAPPCPRHKM
jgi:hypothetical protein